MLLLGVKFGGIQEGFRKKTHLLTEQLGFFESAETFMVHDDINHILKQ